MAILLKWNIKKIVFLPFGGITIFNEILNKPLKEEFLIAIMGPLFQIAFTILINNSLLHFYSKIILMLNLIPIYPLDGSKILNVFFNKILPFKTSHKLTIYFSYLTGLSIYVIFNKNLVLFLFISTLIFKLKREFDNHEFIFNKFLYERYLYDLNFKKIKIVLNEKKFKKDYYHFIKKGSKVIEEKLYLQNYVYNKI